MRAIVKRLGVISQHGKYHYLFLLQKTSTVEFIYKKEIADKIYDENSLQ